MEGLQALLSGAGLDFPLYRFALALAVFLFFLLFRKIFVFVLIRGIEKAVSKTSTDIDDIALRIVSKPLSFVFVILGAYLSLHILEVETELVDRVVLSLVIFVLGWAGYNAVIVLESEIFRFAGKFGKELEREIGSFLIKIAKAFVIIVSAVAILQEWGINVSALIASLGLGGLAFALAAKDTAANLFGGLTVLADKSMKVGDWIKVGGVEGIVEDIGLRTTKIRSFEKSLITVPNQILANQSLENFSRRGVRRIKMIVGLTYDTSREQMVKILEEIRQMLRDHPRIAKDQLCMVYFRDFGDSSLDIFIYCFTDTANWEEYLSIREDVNLRIMEIVERNGSSFAFPSRSIYIEQLPEGFSTDKE